MKTGFFQYKNGLLTLLIIICSLVFLHGCDIFLHDLAKREFNDDSIGLGGIGGGPSASHNVIFDLNGGDGISVGRQYGSADAVVVFPDNDNFDLPGFTFQGWTSQANGTGTTYKSGESINLGTLLPNGGTITLYARWTYTVTFISNSVTFATRDVNRGSPPTRPTPNPTNNPPGEIYFIGWLNGAARYYFNVPFNGNTTLTAEWSSIEPNTHTVSFDENGGSGNMTAVQIVDGDPYTITANEFTYIGHTFTGWNTAANGSGTSYAAGAPIHVTEDITLYAQWRANRLIINYANGGGTGSAPTSPISALFGGADVTMPTNTYTRTNYTFAGWRVSSTGDIYPANTSVAVLDLSPAIEAGDATITLTATWEQTTFTVTFNSNGGTTAANPTTKTVEHPATLIDELPTAPSWSGWTFTGWNSAANGSGTAFTELTPVTVDREVFAQWQIILDGTTPERAFLVRNEAELRMVGMGTANTDSAYHAWTMDKHYQQVASFTMTGGPFPPIGGTAGTPTQFSGSYNGLYNGNVQSITNLSITSVSTHINGMFRQIAENGKVENLNLINVSVDVLDFYSIGSLAGRNYGTISNVQVSGTVIQREGTAGSGIGGLVGSNYGTGTINNSHSTANVTGRNNVGGLTGDNRGSINNSSAIGTVTTTSTTVNSRAGGLTSSNDEGGTIINSYAIGSVTGSHSSGGYLGGLVGHNYENCSISNSYATGDVTGAGYLGGLVGYNQGGSISNTYATGNVNGTSTTISGTTTTIIVGGLVGSNTGAAIISNSYATGAVTVTFTGAYASTSNMGGLVGQNSGTIQNSVALNPRLNGGTATTTTVRDGRVAGYTLGSYTLTNNYARIMSVLPDPGWYRILSSLPGSPLISGMGYHFEEAASVPLDPLTFPSNSQHGASIFQGTLASALVGVMTPNVLIEILTQAWWTNSTLGPGFTTANWDFSNLGGGTYRLPIVRSIAIPEISFTGGTVVGNQNSIPPVLKP